MTDLKLKNIVFKRYKLSNGCQNVNKVAIFV
jgi:hypothetical protein